MDELLKYLESQRVGVIAVKKPDGSLHGATVHFACMTDPLRILIGTSAGSIKGQAVLVQGETAASFVVGTDEALMATAQMDGGIRSASDAEAGEFDAAYLQKLPEKAERMGGENFLRLIFIPTWWRYSDMKNKVVVDSEISSG